jgi:hypothetical protein
MKSCSALIIILLTISVALPPISAEAQCLQKMEVRDIKTGGNTLNGSFKIAISSNSSYKGQVIQIDGINQRVVADFKGQGADEFKFSKLDHSQDLRYRAVVEFSEEEAVLCRKKFIDIDFKSVSK